MRKREADLGLRFANQAKLLQFYDDESSFVEVDTLKNTVPEE